MSEKERIRLEAFGRVKRGETTVVLAELIKGRSCFYLTQAGFPGKLTAMPRLARQCPGGYVYPIWNRGAGRLSLFTKDEDYAGAAARSGWWNDWLVLA